MGTGRQEKENFAAGNWASMDTDILCSIFTRLPFVDLLRVEPVCWGWNAAVDLFKSCSATSLFPETPWLIFTPDPDDVGEGEKAGRFVNIEEDKIYPFNGLAVKKMNDCSRYCVGSSHDWLIFEDREGIPFLLNPFTSHKIDLPARVSFSIVLKAVLSSSPSIDNNYYLAMVYRLDDELAFCKAGDTSWTNLHRNPADYYEDIIFHKNQLYGLYKGYSLDREYGYGIRVWDMNQDGVVLIKNIDLVLAKLITRPPIIGFTGLVNKTYLVESQGNLLFVTRFRMYRNRYDSKIQALGDATSRFHVFELDADQKFLSEVMTSLSGFSLFLGRNQSISVDVRNCKMLKQDAIYFNADVGEFSGVFSLKDCSWLCANRKLDPTSGATWVVPCMKKRDTSK